MQTLRQQSQGDLLFLGFRILILALFSYTFDYSSYNAAEQPAVPPSSTGIHGHILKASLLQAPTKKKKKIKPNILWNKVLEQMTWKWLLHSAGVGCRHMSPDSVDLKASKHSDCGSRSSFLLTEIKAKSRLDFLWERELFKKCPL